MALWTRIWLGAATVFWVAMSVLLWRAEFGPRHSVASSVPPGLVWRKMLSAPDTSTLEIRQGTNRIGSCLWRPDIGQEAALDPRLLEEEEPIEGVVQRIDHYRLEVEGTVSLPGIPTRLRFSSGARLDTNYVWRDFDASVTMRPDVYQVTANHSNQTIRVRVDAGAEQIDREFRFADFQNPQRLLQEFGGPMLPAMASALGVPLSTNKMSTEGMRLRWEARHDSIIVGNNRVRAYRLQTKLFERWRITIFVSPVGEILRAEIPGEIVLVNEHLTGLRNAADHD